MMCGIFAAAHNPKTSGVHVGKVLMLMRYRGPDEQRVLNAGDFATGFARLAIVDTLVPAASQPYRSEKGKIIAFNGEVYNYRDLWPQAPSEVALIAAMLDEGMDPRHFIDGDYAILSHDPSLHEVTLYRDRFGICPLYYQLKPYFAVSSEARYLARPIEVRPHQKVVVTYSVEGVGYLRSRHTIPHYGVTLTHFAPNAFRSMFLEAVRSRAQHSDSGFSVTCSGGLDSSAVVLALRALGLRPSAMLCVSYGEDTEDLRVARELAAFCKWPLTEIVMREERIKQEQEQIQTFMDTKNYTGLGWRVAVRDWFVAKNSPTRVVLTGEGADELFEGYPPHPERLKIPYRIAQKQLGALRSLPYCSLQFSNKIGLAHSKEFRAPFLQSALSYMLLASQTGAKKKMLRDLLSYFGAPVSLVERGKWGLNEQRLDASVPV